MTRTLPILCAIATILPLTAFSQERIAGTGEAPNTGNVGRPGEIGRDRPAVTYNEIERGFFIGAGGGPTYIFEAPSNEGPRPESWGQMAQIDVGFDIGERLSISAFLIATANRAGSEYTGYSGGLASGDFSALIPGGEFRFRIVGFSDSQEVKRAWIYVRAGAGYAMFAPKKLLPDPDILLTGGPGIEYFTRLRHFSVSFDATFSYLLDTQTPGVALTPSIRYAF